MKILVFFLMFFCFIIDSFGGSPITECPSGFIAVEEENYNILDETASCPIGTQAISVYNNSCSDDPSFDCIMYAPSNTQYTDETGTYIYTEICPLSE